jgi:cell cycle arrest protein BUB2
VLLRVPNIDARKYISLVERGSSSLYQKIRNDTFRTFPHNVYFTHRVPENRMIRVLNAFIHGSGRILAIRKS